MAIALIFLSSAVIVLSMYGVLLPHRLIEHIDGAMTGRIGLWSAVIFRLALAALLWFTAPVSYSTGGFQALAVILALSAIAHAVVGRRGLKELRVTLAAWPPWAIRGPCLLGVAMGAYMIWAVSPAISAL